MVKKILLIVSALLLAGATVHAQTGMFLPFPTEMRESRSSIEPFQSPAANSIIDPRLQPPPIIDQTGIESERATSPDTRQEQAKPLVTEREKTAAEKYFAKPFPAVGEAVTGDRSQESVGEQDAIARNRLSQLLIDDEKLSLGEKVQIFRQLDTAHQRRYLQQLPIEQRRSFLRALGQEEFWFAEDLRADEVNLELRQFGLDFFIKDRAGAAPDKLALVGPDYIVGPGDTLIVTIWGSIDGQYRLTVGRNGEIVLPKVGAVSVWGQTFAEAKETIRSQVGRYYKNFEMNVTLDDIRSIQVFVVGEVHFPGSYTVSSVSTVLTTLGDAGGPTGNGSLRQVQLRRGGKTVAVVDLYNFFLYGDKSQDLRLQSGDTLFVPVAGPLVGVAGEVRRPAIYELLGGESLEDVLSMAGGTTTAALRKIQVERIDRVAGKKVVLDFDLSTAGQDRVARPLQDRDLVKVLPISSLTGSYVRLVGHVARSGTFPLTPSMRVTDLVDTDNNLLPGYFPGLVEILRLQPPEFRPERLTVHLESALKGDPEHNILLQEYDEIRIFSSREMEEISEVAVSGSVLNPGSYRLYDAMTVRDLVVASGNVRRRAYLPEAEITRFIPVGRETRSERIIIDLGKALEGDPAHNLPLLADDHLFVRSIPDFGEKQLVEINGEVLFPGTYAIHKGETLSSVLERAGGYTDKAFLRGAMFTRESIKELQRKNVEQLIFEQEQEIFRISSEMAQGALSAEDKAAAQILVANRTAMLNKLRKAPVLGRMVIRLEPLEEFRGSSSDIELVHGDVVTVPQNPQTVSVFGQVYNQTSLTYRPGKTVGHYLSQVGGIKKTANEDEIFIVRADGSVISAAQGGWGVRWDRDSNRWIAGGFNATILQPGDSILVPEKVQQIAWMRGVRDISAILFSLALGAAAVAAL